MKIVIPGGTGQVGTLLARAFVRDGHEVVVLARHVTPAPWPVVAWNPAVVSAWADEFNGADVVINLAGRSVNCRYTPANRAEIMESRVSSVHAVGRAIARARRPPSLWLQMSTATIYSHRFDAPNDEATGVIGGAEPDAPAAWRFSIDVARAWEQALDDASPPSSRTVKLRSAMVMSPDRGGVFDTLVGLVRTGLGGTSGSGRQYVSWIHEEDFVRAIYWLIAHDHVTGAVNLASPHPLPNRNFMAELRTACRVPIGLPAIEWMLEVGAVVLGTETELLLKSRRVVPGRLLAAGFPFAYGDWPSAARELCDRWKRLRPVGVQPRVTP